jgi:hypothetical protein
MNIEDLTKEQVENMSDEEVALWFGVLQRQNQSKQMRKQLLNVLDIQEAQKDEFPRIHVDSEVVG